MEKWKKRFSRRTRVEKMLDEFTVKSAPAWGFFVLVAVYIAANVFVNLTSASEGFIIINNQRVMHRTLTGAFSSIDNLCIVMLVVLYKKPGFIAATVALLVQFPSLLIRMIQGNYSVIPGFFTNILMIVTVSILRAFIERSASFQAKMRDQALTDRLTGLPNRFAVTELMDGMIRKNEPFAIALINLNYFKNINNAMGQQAGDKALVQLADRWQKLAESGKTGTRDIVACQNGNEFAVIIRDYHSEEMLHRSVECYAEVLKEKIVIDDSDFVLSASFGYASFPADAKDSETLFDNAYAAMIRAKTTDHTGYICRFTEDMIDSGQAIETARRIREALDKGRLFFKLQPQFDMDHRLRGFEALARMTDENGNLIPPGDFIPVAEKNGLVERIDHEVLFGATEFIGRMVKKYHSGVVLSVNASVRHLLRNGFVEEVKTALDRSGLPPEQLEIEITESIMIDSVEKAIDCIHQITALGVHIAIDDFGTGYSSLSYLNSFPVDVLKVDQSFIIKMHSGEASKQYVAAIIAIGHVMNFRVVAEGVEETDQLEDLREIGCDYIQGFLWGKPMSPEEAEKLMEAEWKHSQTQK